MFHRCSQQIFPTFSIVLHLQCRLVDVCAQRSGFAKQRQEVSMEVDRAERRSKELKDDDGQISWGISDGSKTAVNE
jgi:hypothetical protein